MAFYESVFGGTLTVMTFADAGANDVPDPQQVMHAMLETSSGYTLMASDLPPGMEHQPGTAFSVSLSGDDDAELRGYWAALSEGAKIEMPLDLQMWGDVFGSCTDRFGVNWMVNIMGSAAQGAVGTRDVVDTAQRASRLIGGRPPAAEWPR
jgi:PhnB protein